MVINNRFEEPYNKFPQDGPIPLLSKPIVISKLSKRFWLYTQYLRNQNILKNDDSLDEKEYKFNENNNLNNSEDNNIGQQHFQRKENINFKKNIGNKNRPKSSTGYGKNILNKKNVKYENENENEINELKEIIVRLQNELSKQDFIINSQINEKMKLEKRIHELEIVLKNFC